MPTNSVFRPSERVRHYLLTLLVESGQRDPEMSRRLPSIRQVARQMKVSTTTVQTVFQKLADEGKIRSEIGSGTFWVDRELSQNEVLYFGTNIPVSEDPPAADWSYRIYGGILHGILQSERPIVLRPLPEEALETDASATAFLNESRDRDGFILFPGPFCRRLRRLCEEEGKPAVDLNPWTESATKNFVSPDYYSASRMIGIAARRAGRRRIVVLVSPSLEESVSVRLRFAGMAAGLGAALGQEIQMRVVVAGDRDEEMGRQAVKELFDGSFRPDCIYCAGDGLAMGALMAAQEAGISVPDDLSVIGGNGLGSNLSTDRELTSMCHPIDMLGNRLVSML
ncbi:MAG TPA: substrate-binding domain-containing protein, partial [Opitutales bacterium]|nr:substrate-binding domain-containing protein [Opitutales bacterium]